MVSLAVLLASVDAAFISYAFQSTITKGASVQLVFGFEYAILLTIVVNTVVKYILNSIDLHSENPWEGKAVCLLYAELVLGFIKVKVHAIAHYALWFLRVPETKPVLEHKGFFGVFEYSSPLFFRKSSTCS